MIYLLLGADINAKDKKIAQLKKEYLGSLEALKFDYESLQAIKCDSDELKKSLLSLPTVAPKRVVVIRFAQKLSTHNKEIILEFIQRKEDYLVLILDWADDHTKNSFLNKISPSAKTLSFFGDAAHNVFDMTRAMGSRQPAQALKILDTLLEEGNHPLQLMGGLVWYWGNSRNRMAVDRFKKGLTHLQEADLNIKRSRINPGYALETCVVKLCSLIA